MIISVLMILVAQFFSVQGEVQVILRYAELPAYDKEYVTEPEVYIYDDSKIFLNFSIIKQFPPTTEGYFALIGATMGEYVIDSGIDVRIPFCEMLDFGLGSMMSVFAFTEDNCPPKPGVYGNEGFVFPTNDFTDNFPANQYKALLEITNEDKEIMTLSVFFDIQ